VLATFLSTIDSIHDSITALSPTYLSFYEILHLSLSRAGAHKVE